MDLSKVSPERQAVLKRIDEYEKAGRFDVPVEDDPPAKELLPSEVDYLCKKLSSRFKRRLANRLGDKYFLGLIKKGALVIDGITGEENLGALQNGAIVTCNHFSVCDHYIVFHCLRKYLPKKYLYKVIREGNYTGFSGLYGLLFRHCNTLPLSSNRRTMISFTSAVNELLKRGESILVYPEQEMWWNYKNPRPFKVGAFKLAYRAGVPVLPTLVTMEDEVEDGKERLDENGYPVQRHTLHVLKAVYPDQSLGEKAGAEKMRDEAFALCKQKYEEVYAKPLVYGTESIAESANKSTIQAEINA